MKMESYHTMGMELYQGCGIIPYHGNGIIPRTWNHMYMGAGCRLSVFVVDFITSCSLRGACWQLSRVVGARGCWAAISIRGWWWGLDLQPRGCWALWVLVSCCGLMLLMMGIGMASLSFVMLVHCSSSIVRHGHCRLVSFTPWSSPQEWVWRLAINPQWVPNSGGVMLVRWVKMVVGVHTAFIWYGTTMLGHAQHRVHPFMAVRCCQWFPWALVVVWESLCSLGVVVIIFGARSSYLGGCRHSWAVGSLVVVVLVWCGMVVRCMCDVLWLLAVLSLVCGGCWLKKQCHSKNLMQGIKLHYYYGLRNM